IVGAAPRETLPAAQEYERGAEQRVRSIALLVDDGLCRSGRIVDQIGRLVAQAAGAVGRAWRGPRWGPAEAHDPALVAPGRLAELERRAVVDVFHPLQAVPVQDGAAGQDGRAHGRGLAWGPSGSSRAVAAVAVVGVRPAVGTG